MLVKYEGCYMGTMTVDIMDSMDYVYYYRGIGETYLDSLRLFI